MASSATCGLGKLPVFGIGGGKRGEVARLLAIGKIHCPLGESSTALLLLRSLRSEHLVMRPGKIVENLGLIGCKPSRLGQMFDYFLRFARPHQRHRQLAGAMAMLGSRRIASRKCDTASDCRSRLTSVWPHIKCA